jgi:putative FmdB family regulatory protein
MPSYSYVCQVCGIDFEKRLPINADHEQVSCPDGHTYVQRIYTAPRVTFKGSGFYATDSRRHSNAHSSS